VARSSAFYDTIVGPQVSDLLALRESERPGPAPTRATGLFHTAFVYPTRGQLGSALLRVASERAAFSGASDHLVSEALYLDDPDALGIELYRDRPRETWPAPQPGERVRMDTLPLDLRALATEATGRRGGRPTGEPGWRAGGNAAGDSSGVRIGHVHLKVADVEEAVRFWTDEIGLELMAGWAGQAAFLAADGYHHHVGVNAWHSRGADPEPPEGPGLDAVVIGGTGRDEELRTPDGLRVVLEP
jgi:catechol 2,3-dioxygenase